MIGEVNKGPSALRVNCTSLREHCFTELHVSLGCLVLTAH